MDVQHMKPYSVDLRKRVLEMCDAGEKRCVIAKIFSLDEKTIYLWKKQRKERGFIHGITKYQNGHSHKINDLHEFKKFVDKNPTLSTAEMAKILNICKTTVQNYMHKICYTRKKRPLDTWKEMRFYEKNSKKKSNI
jgi:transposase